MATTVSGVFTEFRASLRLTDYEKGIAQGRVRHVHDFFEEKYVCDRPAWVIGSYGRETLVRQSRDIDMMVALSRGAYWPRYQDDSRSFLYSIRNALNAEYGDTQVSTQQVAVRMKLGAGLQVDLVPVFVRPYQDGFVLPDGRGGWQATNPPYHDKVVTDTNVALGYDLKPLVRVMKAWNHANGRHLRSFHLEMIVERMWRDAVAIPRLPEAVAKTLELASGWVHLPFKDPWSGSGRNLDAYLSSNERDLAMHLLDEDAIRARSALDYAASAKTAAAIERWRVVFGSGFPSYG